MKPSSPDRRIADLPPRQVTRLSPLARAFDRRLADLPAKQPVCVTPDAPVALVLRLMHERRIGSVLVEDGMGGLVGILTRHDVLGRVALAERSLATPVGEVMSAPVRALSTTDTVEDAALLMSGLGIRHLPVLEGGKLVNVVSERELFALDRLSPRGIGIAIRAAQDLCSMQRQAQAIRTLAGELLDQGVHARPLTALVSHLNDLLARRMVHWVAQRRGMDLLRACWLAFGSEGRGEQTVATDQDNGLVIESDAPERDRPAWLALAAEVNDGLNACGQPLCQGGIMASNPACCLNMLEWRERFDRWMDQGTPQDLLNASIFFDLRGIAGRLDLAERLRRHLTERAATLPRFHKLLALNALQRRPPLNWRGSIRAKVVEGQRLIDLKLQGTALFVEAARIGALAHGIEATGTAARLQAFASLAGVPSHEGAGWVTAFEGLQMLRLRSQLAAGADQMGQQGLEQVNLLNLATLDDVEAKMLRESLRMAQRLQQRLALDYQR
jgi:CBS domain-containing protein